MNSDEAELSRVLNNAVPALPEPPDRVGAVRTRVRRYRTVATAATTTVAAVGVALAAGVPALLTTGTGEQPYHVAAPQTSPIGEARVHTAGCATANSAPATSVEGTEPANQATLDDVAQRLRPAAEARFADVFTELEMRQETNRIRVYRKPSVTFDEWIKRDFATDCVEMVDARYSGRELTAFVARVEADRAYWRARGVELNTVSVGIDGTVTVGVDRAQLDGARSDLPSRYPMRVVVVEEAAVPPAIMTPGSPR